MLASLAFTDYVSIIDFPGAVECIKALKPHFYVKGPDYRDKEKDKTGKIYLEESAIESVGGRLIFTEDITLSSTLLIRKNSVSVIESTELLRERINDTFSGLITALDGIESSDISGRKIGFVEAIQSSITLILFHASMGKKIILIGNGGSASICSHLATDYTKNAGIPALAFNDPVFLTAISNDFGFDQVFVKLIESFSQESDIVIAISSSGESENIIKGVNRAKEMGCKVITFSGFNQGNRLRAIGDFNFYIPENKYGLAEIAHMTINHFIADLIINK
jgi:D-sedoheptulose 7-phosphate isomerase